MLVERTGVPHWEQLGSLKQVHHHQHPPATSTSSHSLEDDIVAEHFTRNVQFFGREAQQKIMGSFVVVVGLGVSSQLPQDLLPFSIFLASTGHLREHALSM